MDIARINDEIVAIEQIYNEAMINEMDDDVDISDLEPGTLSMLSAVAGTLMDSDIPDPPLGDLLVMIKAAALMHAEETIGCVITQDDLDRHFG